MFDALESEQYGTSFGRENGTVILNAMTVAMINEDLQSVWIVNLEGIHEPR